VAPLRILFLAANPLETKRLRLDEEVRTIQDRLRGSPLADRISISSAWAVRVRDLARLLREQSPDIVHFSGHASPGGVIVESDDGTAAPVPLAALADLFGLEGRGVRCVVLNACYTEGQAKAIAEHVPFVVGTWPFVLDKDAVAFAGRFYEAIAHGDSLAMAMERGENEIALRGGETGVHRSFLMPGADPTRTVLLRKPPRWPWAIAGLVAISAVAGGLWQVWPRPPEVVYQNTELIFDSSTAMKGDLPGSEKSKLEVALGRIIEFVLPRTGDRLALRAAAACDQGGDLLVPFRTEASSDIRRALLDLQAEGDFPLANAVISATTDFNDVARFPPQSTRRQIIVITASGDTCIADPAAAAARLAERWTELGTTVELRVDFIGLGLTDNAAQQLAGMASAVRGRRWLVDTEEQLRDLIRYLIDLEPVIEAANKIGEVGSDVRDATNEIVDAANRCELDAARDAVGGAKAALSAASPALTDLAGRNARPAYVRVHQAGAAWIARLGDVIAANERLVQTLEGAGAPAAGEPCDSFRAIDRSWKDAVTAQLADVRAANAAAAALAAVRDDLLDEVPTLPPG
jgi:CHAT domain